MDRRNICIKGTKFEPHFTEAERQRGVRYITAIYGNVKVREMSPKDFGLLQARRMHHNHKNKRK